MRRLLADRRARIGIGAVAILLVAALLGPLFMPYGPAEQIDVLNLRNQPPSAAHLFGTDHLSRDLLSRILAGTRLSLIIAFLSVSLSVTVGAGIGLVAGFAKGIVDVLLMRFVDAALAVPRIVLLLVAVTVWRTDVVGLVVVLGLTSWFGTSRIVRAEVLSLRERAYVVAAYAAGATRTRLLLRHLLPNVMAPVIVIATLSLGHIVLIEAGLSFLGAGVPRPTPSLGGMINDGADRLLEAPWISIFPGLVIVLIVIGFSLIGDGLRHAIDPRST